MVGDNIFSILTVLNDKDEKGKESTVSEDKQRIAAPGLDKIPYKPGDPIDFKTYLGQDQHKRRLQLRINAMKRGESLKALFSASPGLGKTALARVIAREMGKKELIDHYFEIVAGKVETKKQLDEFLKILPPNSAIFIDEIHGLQGISRDALLPALQDNVYAFDEGSDTMTALPEGLTWLGATTDVGKVHKAVQRRFTVYDLEPMSLSNRRIMLMLLPFPTTNPAVNEIAIRCKTPWEAKDEAYEVAKDIALENQVGTIEHDHVIEAFDILGIDERSLRTIDRRVLEVLYNNPKTIKGELRYGMSARALIAATGLDSPTFYDQVEPKLLNLGYIQISSGVGREITPRAIQHYFKET
jgi:Holliday junction resolvasome RuvABC ATP-dependent DNA helicase subunit